MPAEVPVPPKESPPSIPSAKLGKELGSQAVSLLTRTGLPIKSLQQKYYTPVDAGVPTHKSVKIIHRPILISPPDPPPRSSDDPVDRQDESGYVHSVVINEKNTLDGFVLLQATGMSLPDDGRTASLPERKLKAVIAEDLTFFKSLLYLDVSENELPLEPFGVLPALEELRIACNNIYEIGDIPINQGHFERLLRLDLSYNNLTLRSVQVLDAMPCLVELDLCGNNLRGLPMDMFRFPCLEKLLLEHNKIDDNGILITLCCMGKLRYVSLAYNFLGNIPQECCGEGFFRLLEHIDLSFNYFAAEKNVQSLIHLPRLSTVVLYGNPLLGPTGEDPLQTYIEDLINAAIDVRVSQNKKEIEFITEVPRQRTLKKGVPSGRQATYRDFEVVAVKEEGNTKPTREWREQGRKTMFAEAVAAARQKIKGADSVLGDMTTGSVGGGGGGGGVGGGNENVQDFTFLTGSVSGSVVSDSYRSTKLATGANPVSAAHAMDAIAEDIMGRVAVEMGIGQATSAELLLLRDKIMLKPSLVSRMDGNDDNDEEGQQQQQHGRDEAGGGGDGIVKNSGRNAQGFFDEQTSNEAMDMDMGMPTTATATAPPTTDTLPRNLFSGAAFDNDDGPKLSGHPVPLATAVAALKFAVRNPVTNYDEVPAKGFLPPKNYVQPTAASRNRRLPRRESSSSITDKDKATAVGGGADSDHHADIKGKITRGLPEPLDARKGRERQREETLQQIEDVLDGLNTNTDQLIRKKDEKKAAEEFEMMNYFARPNTGLSKLLTMVNEVIADLDEK